MLKELDVIIETCSKGKQISNFQLRSIITSLAANLKEVAAKPNNGYKDKKVEHTSDEQLMQMKSQLNKKFQSFASERIPKYIREQVTQLEKKVGEYLTQERSYVISLEQRVGKFEKKPESSSHLLEKQLTKKIQQEASKLKSYLNQQLDKIKKTPTNQSNQEIPKINFFEPSKKMEEQNYLNSSRLMPMFPSLISSTLGSAKDQNQSIINASAWVDPCCRLYKNIIFDKLNPNNLSVSNTTLVLGKQRIINKYQLIIENKKFTVNQIGVTDASYRQMLNLDSLPNKASYRSTGYYNLGNSSSKVPGGGYQQGQTVTMDVDIKTGTISWIVGSNIKFQRTFTKLIDSSIAWVPFVMMGNFQIATIKQSKTY